MQYLPDDRYSDFFKRLRRRVGYNFWKRKIERFSDREYDGSTRVLSVGCGAGYLLEFLEEWYDTSVFGGDVEREHVAFAADNAPDASVSLFDGARAPFQSETFDLVFCLQVAEHVGDPERLFTEINRILTPGGLFVMTTPNPDGVAARVLGEGWQGYKPDHISLRPPDEWRRTTRHSGFQILSDGTTLLTGFSWVRRTPLAALNWGPMAVFGYFPWDLGESYKMIARKTT